jgi:hypothetical protein
VQIDTAEFQSESAILDSAIPRSSGEKLDVGSSDEAWFDPLNLIRDSGQLPVCVLLIGADRNHCQASALPEIVVPDLRNRDVELLHPVLDAAEHHALLFQRLRAGNEKLQGEESDNHGECTNW